MSVTTILIIAIIVSGLLHLKGEYFGPDKIKYAFKPLTTFLILLIAWLAVTNDSPLQFYKQMIIAGIFFSIWGDVFLMLPQDRFIPGLISFLIAHIFYIIAFSANVPQIVPIYYIIPYIFYGIIIFRYLSEGMGKLRIPVILYITVIMTMVFLAMSQFFIIHDIYSLYAFIGAIFFMISDSILAINKFRFKNKRSGSLSLLESPEENKTSGNNGEFKSARLLVMSTYYTAQVFIALSVH